MNADRPVMACDAPELALVQEGPARFGEFDIQVQRVAPRQRHKRMAESLAFDICEFSLVDYLHGVQRGLRCTAIPVFPHRVFRHRDIWVANSSAIEEPKDLTGRRVGLQSWTNSASVWQRGMLADDFGVDLKSIEWITESAEQPGARRAPDWARIRPKDEDRSLDQMLANGTIDALLLPRPPEISPEETTCIRPLFTDPVAVEQDYHARTGIFPIMHVMVIKNDLLGSRPAIAGAVYRGVQSALDHFVERQRRLNASSVVWPALSWSEQERHLGPDPWPAGIEANRDELDLLIRYAAAQGILSEPISAEDLFRKR
jgi:4,5-dihydroxyphthalate decarboxylase